MTNEDRDKLMGWFFGSDPFPTGIQFENLKKWFSGEDGIPRLLPGDHWSEVEYYFNKEHK